MYTKRLLFFFDQYFAVRLGENLYRYHQGRDNFSFLRAWLSLLLACLRLLKKKQPVSSGKKSSKHIFYVETINQRNAIIAFLQRMDRKDILLVINDDINKVSLAFSGFENLHVPAASLYFRALFSLLKAWWIAPVLIKKYASTVNKSHVYINLALFLSAVRFFHRLLRQQKPVSVTVVNDHNLNPLALIFAARYSNVLSIYIQHASVSDAFPKVLVDVALLEGPQAKETYDRMGNYAKQCRFVGIPRLDGFMGWKRGLRSQERLTVGLCLKSDYTSDLVSRSIQNIRKSGRAAKIILRPHPGSSKAFWDQLGSYGLEVSDSRVQDAMTFLQSVDVLISGESTIILEAALMKIPAIHFHDGSFVFPFDLYGFVKHKVAQGDVRSSDDLARAVDEIDFQKVEENFLNCQYYCSTVNTPFENKSGEILLEFYKSLE